MQGDSPTHVHVPAARRRPRFWPPRSPRILTIQALCLGLLALGCDSDHTRRNAHLDPSEPGQKADGGGSPEVVPRPDAGPIPGKDPGKQPTDGPTSTSVCGDGRVDHGEGCELSLTPTQDCTDISGLYVSGQATCGSDCRLNLTDCVRREPRCGDGVVDGGELCEPSLTASQSCSAIAPQFGSGDASCTASCTWDTSACTLAASTCGNGVIEGGELCDDGNTEAGDDCGPDCAPSAEGEPILYEGPPLGGAPGDGIFGDSVCRNAEQRRDDRLEGVTEVLYVILLCNQTGGTHRGDIMPLADVRASMEAVARTFRRDANIKLVEHSVERYDDDDCVMGYESLEPYALAGGHESMVPIIFTGGVQSLFSAFPIGGYAREGHFVVTTNASTAPTVTTHELGHFFGLDHTHECGLGVETATNCGTTGDRFCDTPPDRGPVGVASIQSCNRASKDGAGMCPRACGSMTCSDGVIPDRDNVMSYYHCWPGNFSAEQSDYMRCQVDEGPLRPFNWRSVHIGPETCNNLDDDNDGQIDEGVTRTCGLAEGACSTGIQRCHAGLWDETCQGADAPLPEVCDGLDNDCDGSIDEGVDPLTEAVVSRCPNKGICADGAARDVCRSGQWECQLPDQYVHDECTIVQSSCGSGSLGDATCLDGRDNDCDGASDEHSLYPACAAHPNFDRVARGETCFASPYGRCATRGGTYECVQLAESCGISVDCQGAIFPETEQCDGQDWDCDGRTYDRNDYDGDGFGDCPGRADCNESAPGTNPSTAEICNGVDDNCNQQADENFECGPGRTTRSCDVCGTVTGVQYCDQGSCSYQRECRAGDSLPVLEAFFEGNHPSLYHSVGNSCNGSHWCAVGIGSRTLSYGPYMPLGAASYRVSFVGTWSSGDLWFDVFDATLGVTLASSGQLSTGITSTWFAPSLSFTIPVENSCHQIEFRMHTRLPWPGGAELWSIELTRDTHYRLP